MKPLTRLAVAASGITAVSATFALATGMATTTHASGTATPPLTVAAGNNGDFKIDGPPFDPTDPNNGWVCSVVTKRTAHPALSTTGSADRL